MFYGEGVEPRQIMEQMIAAQREIAKQPLQVGMAIHSGEFLLIGGGAFGPDADLVEALAEDYSGAREIVVTPSFRSALEGCAFPGLGFAPKGETGAFVCDYNGAPRREFAAQISNILSIYRRILLISSGIRRTCLH
jgi:hypothetical protein